MNQPKPRLPPHAYVPGKTPRHPEDWFEFIKSSLTPQAHVVETQCWKTGLYYLHQGYHWECHELLEPVWMSLPNPSPERDMVQALIQLANARLKLKMERPKATLRLCDIIDDLLCAHSGTILGLSVAEVSQWVAHTRETAI